MMWPLLAVPSRDGEVINRKEPAAADWRELSPCSFDVTFEAPRVNCNIKNRVSKNLKQGSQHPCYYLPLEFGLYLADNIIGNLLEADRPQFYRGSKPKKCPELHICFT